MPRIFIDDCLFITWLLIKKSFGNKSGKSSLLLALWKIENFVLLTFKGSLFEINHSLIFCNSLLTGKKRKLMSLCSKNWFASSANIIVFNKWRHWEDHLRLLRITVDLRPRLLFTYIYRLLTLRGGILHQPGGGHMYLKLNTNNATKYQLKFWRGK